MISNAPLLDHYTLMWRMRAFEEACLEGFKSREIHGELHTGIGQEGIAAGIAPHRAAPGRPELRGAKPCGGGRL